MAHDDHGHGDPHLAHHFDTRVQQFEAAKLGMWLFLAQEILFFGGLFCAYAVFRSLHPEIYHYSSHYLDKIMGAINTVVLLISSLTMALAVRSSMLKQKTPTLLWLGLTFICATTFMVVKYFEYSHKIHAHTVMAGLPHRNPESGDIESAKDPQGEPRRWFGTAGFEYDDLLDREHSIAKEREKEHARLYGGMRTVEEGLPAVGDQDRYTEGTPARPPSGLSVAYATADSTSGTPHSEVDAHHGAEEHHHLQVPEAIKDAPRPRDVHLFFGIYFCLTGLHGIHVLAGMVMIAWMMWGIVTKNRFVDGNFTAIDLGGLYWHLVDLVWIFLFPLLYLIG